ncbi:asparagine synthase (glutamine-hydrolyzing) [uncultured Microscilla sp.]|uniref:asparagine synthase (glutamine-hydrolyzing) n=1 Tax=uncultured Microscilla sp. TaxID=432653 RepID=UPI00261A1FBE|nr:asparagine synthase (glutamine-hydrolyzing) [uncultured Microscilla sp.]
MCGITGIFHFDKDRRVQQNILKQMTDIIHHRGPDGEGFYCHNNIGLGHRRLSIIDLSTGDQPMFNDDRSIALIFNGEIYNYIELKEELKTLGHRFHTTSDTEVIIRAYEQWGIDCQNKFNGMWGFALWDKHKQQLLLSIDRLGIKPLHYGIHDNTLLFGSEIKSLLAYGFPTKPNDEVLGLYLTLSYLPAPYTYYKDIKKLQPGHCLIIREGQVTEKKYWDIPQVPEAQMLTDKVQVYEQFESILKDAVKIRMRSDVPFGAFLSGGLDSSSVVALMSQIASQPVETFTIGFQDKAYDESHLAQEVATRFNTKHTLNYVQPDSFEEALKHILFHYDEPFGDSSAIPTGYVSKYARQNVKMVLTGDGGDEVLSGYTVYQGEKFAHQYQKLPGFIRKGIPNAVNVSSKLMRGRLKYTLNRISAVTEASNQGFIPRLINKVSWVEKGVLQNLMGDSSKYMTIEDYFHDVFAQCNYQDPFYQVMYFNLKISLPFDMLTKVDRMSMAHSLETRIPFLDYRLVELMVKVSKNIKMQGYERKSVLRNTVGKALPKNILHAPKKGFGVPLREWFKEKSFENHLNSLSNQDFGLNSNTIQTIVKENQLGKKDYGNFIWMLFVLRNWLARP